MDAPRDTHLLPRFLLMRVLGLSYLSAFVSLWTQVHGLIGHHGILPIDRTIAVLGGHFGALEGSLRFPTLCWISPGDASLTLQCALGTIASALLTLNLLPRLSLALLWALYLSLATAGLDFMAFQWDALLIEAGFLGIFLAPRGMSPGLGRQDPPSRAFLFLLRFLLFRLYLMSACVKLWSPDPSWRNLTALDWHYWTQPLPTWAGWYAAHLPPWIQRASCLGMFAVELGLPFAVFGSRRLRLLAFGGFSLLQAAIALTGNYAFFNLLTFGLGLALLDDRALARFAPSRDPPPGPSRTRAMGSLLGRWALVALLFWAGSAELLQRVKPVQGLGHWALSKVSWMLPWRTVNGYGLFAVMTKERREIEIEGSLDGNAWKPYGWRFKPQDPVRRPGFVAPHQPRLDWQMWFAALGGMEESPWLARMMDRLREGPPGVGSLLWKRPFRGPPRFVRAVVYAVRPASLQARRERGIWWVRERLSASEPAPSTRNDP